MIQQRNPLQIIERTSVWAIVSLIASLTNFFILPLVGGVIGVVTGNMAKKEILASNGAIAGDNLAHLGIVIGWVSVVLGVIGVVCVAITALTGIATGVLAVAAGGCGLLTKLLDFVK